MGVEDAGANSRDIFMLEADRRRRRLAFEH